jgi:hypothetical protein
MKRLLVFLFLMIPVFGFADQVIWDAPTAYINGDAVPAAKLAEVTYHLYADGVEFASVPNGATTWNGTLPQQPGEVKDYTCTAELDGKESAQSDPTTFAYFVPLNKPGSVTIQLGK